MRLSLLSFITTALTLASTTALASEHSALVAASPPPGGGVGNATHLVRIVEAQREAERKAQRSIEARAEADVRTSGPPGGGAGNKTQVVEVVEAQREAERNADRHIEKRSSEQLSGPPGGGVGNKTRVVEVVEAEREAERKAGRSVEERAAEDFSGPPGGGVGNKTRVVEVVEAQRVAERHGAAAHRRDHKRRDALHHFDPAHRRSYERLRDTVAAINGNNTEAMQKRSPLRFDYGNKKVRGVSLGGWLVIENFITPSLMDGITNDKRVIDEWTLGYYEHHKTVEAAYRKHFNTFITEQDFKDIKAANLNHVRIPVPHWMFGTVGNEPYVVAGQWTHLKQGVKWAKKHGLKVLIDLHTAPGSQNGYDHSGHYGNERWEDKQSRVDRTVSILGKITKEFAKEEYGSTVSAIELLNEPVVQDFDLLVDFYERGYHVVRKYAGDKILVVIGDAWQTPPNQYWNYYMQSGDGYNWVALDSHIYTIFDNDSINMSSDKRRDYYCSKGSDFAAANHWVIAGEFTAAFTDCAKYLNGRFKGYRYSGTFPGSENNHGDCSLKRGPAKHFSKDYIKLLAKMWESQTSSYEKGAGWISWTWKTEPTGEDWSYKAGLKYGWIAKDPAKHPHGFAC